MGTFLVRVYCAILVAGVKRRRLWYRLREGVPPGEMMLRLPPNDIVYCDMDHEGRWGFADHTAHRIIGKVVGGDWDFTRSRVAEWRICNALREFLVEDRELKDTDYFNDGSGRIHYPLNRIWFCINERNYEKEVQRNQKIYDLMRREGYLTQKELGNPDIFNEISVRIGRAGDFLFENSIHRMAISRILQLETVPVLVTIRHAEWAGLRKRLYREAARPGIGPDTGEEYPHPDLRDIPYTSAGMRLLKEHWARFGEPARPEVLDGDQVRNHQVEASQQRTEDIR